MCFTEVKSSVGASSRDSLTLLKAITHFYSVGCTHAVAVQKSFDTDAFLFSECEHPSYTWRRPADRPSPPLIARCNPQRLQAPPLPSLPLVGFWSSCHFTSRSQWRPCGRCASSSHNCCTHTHLCNTFKCLVLKELSPSTSYFESYTVCIYFSALIVCCHQMITSLWNMFDMLLYCAILPLSLETVQSEGSRPTWRKVLKRSVF